MTVQSEVSQYVLLGTSFVEPESDDADEVNVEYIGDEAILNSRSIDITNAIGTPEFPRIYLNLINDIKVHPFRKQQLFCEMFLEKISEVYDFEFPEVIDIDTLETVNELYSFLEFLEYNNIDFISSVWRYLNVDLTRIKNINEFCNKNKKRIIKEIDEQTTTNILDKFSLEFLRTYYKITEWFVVQSEKSKVEIIAKIFEREGVRNESNN